MIRINYKFCDWNDLPLIVKKTSTAVKCITARRECIILHSTHINYQICDWSDLKKRWIWRNFETALIYDVKLVPLLNVLLCDANVYNSVHITYKICDWNDLKKRWPWRNFETAWKKMLPTAVKCTISIDCQKKFVPLWNVLLCDANV